MRDGVIRRGFIAAIAACSVLMIAAMARAESRPQAKSADRKTEASGAVSGAGYISGTVTSSKGPEAGVWVIAETADLPTKFRKIVVTDDQGRYLIPELPKAKYKVWVRGYGLVDSAPVPASPGATLDLRAVPATTARAAAEYYPPDSWYALIQVPPKNAFPMKSSPLTAATGASLDAQGQWIWQLKRGCEVCHQMGEKATREIPSSIGTFPTSAAAWERFLRSGQVGEDEHITALDSFGHERGLAMFSDWSDRIAQGEVPAAPPRPAGTERNAVLTIWDFSVATGFPHDVTSTMRQKPTANPHGPIYSPDWAAGAIAAVDPLTNETSMVRVPLPNENDREKFPAFSAQKVEYPSPYWGSEVVRKDRVNPGPMMMDSKGRMWFNVQTRLDIPSFCKAGSSNPFAKNFPISEIARMSELRNQAAGMDYYDPGTGRFGIIDLCFGGSHEDFAQDKDETLYITARRVNGIGWVKTRVWDETHDAEKSQGWCPAVIDYNGDGKTGAFTRPGQPLDPKLDRYIGGTTGYTIAVNPVDGSAWYQTLDVPGKIIRMVTGANPPETCMTEVYEPPFDFKNLQKQDSYSPEGIDVDSTGIVWIALSGSGQLASFDRRKCKVLNGPTATGQHCPEGWTMYPVPGPKFKGTDIAADFFYNLWVDRFDTSGFGKDISVINGTDSDSLIVFLPQEKKWIRLRVPYPMGFYTRSLEGRIDDSRAGWKGRGLWAANETRTPWQAEGGKGATPFLIHFQIRPDPLAK